jgi:NAD(P)H-hydrate repair Nnr-like enzyme with NAD(P)H-hydrate epimerase domain
MKKAALGPNETFVSRSLVFHQSTIQRLAADKEIYSIRIMKITKNIGMLLLAVYLIVDGLLGFGLNLGPAIFLLYLLAIIAGIMILLGK